jgi:hypothetical protein
MALSKYTEETNPPKQVRIAGKFTYKAAFGSSYNDSSHSGYSVLRQPLKIKIWAEHWWLSSVILATWEAEIRGIKVQGYPRHIVQEIPSPK